VPDRRLKPLASPAGRINITACGRVETTLLASSIRRFCVSTAQGSFHQRYGPPVHCLLAAGPATVRSPVVQISRAADVAQDAAPMAGPGFVTRCHTPSQRTLRSSSLFPRVLALCTHSPTASFRFCSRLVAGVAGRRRCSNGHQWRRVIRGRLRGFANKRFPPQRARTAAGQQRAACISTAYGA
jgi:hypothetical protein